MGIKAYIESGILEAYVFGSASEAEVEELLQLKAQHPEVKDALEELELNLEQISQHMAVAPPPGRWYNIEAELHEIIKRNEEEKLKITGLAPHKIPTATALNAECIEVIEPEKHIRIHKSWRLLTVALILLGLLFLGIAIYMNSKNEQRVQEIRQLKNELQKQ